MKYTILVFAFLLAITFCTTPKKIASTVATVSYSEDVAPIIADRCTPCHFPETGKKKFLDTYAAARNNIDSIIYRVELPVDHPKFMPFKSKKPQLSDSLIQVLKLWKSQDFPS